jgi:hypothetical protein
MSAIWAFKNEEKVETIKAMNGTKNNLNCGADILVRRKQDFSNLPAHSGCASDNPEGAAQNPPELFSKVSICLHGNLNQIPRRERKRIFSEISAEENA